jgi:hypothetical protein
MQPNLMRRHWVPVSMMSQSPSRVTVVTASGLGDGDVVAGAATSLASRL